MLEAGRMCDVAVTREVGRLRRLSRRRLRRVGDVDVQLSKAWREIPRTLDAYGKIYER